MKETYIGDGVYASYDGFQVVLKTQDNIIYLDSHTLRGLMQYMEAVFEVKMVSTKRDEAV